MDNGTKNSLIFGGLVGGLYALARNSGEKRNLTNGQVKDLNALKDAFAQLQSVITLVSLTSVFDVIKRNEPEKKYGEIIAYVDEQAHINEGGIAVIDNFKNRLDQVLSNRFTAERANAKTHEVQSHFASLVGLSDKLGAFVNNRSEILRLVSRVFAYIKAGEATDFKSEDASTLRTLVEKSKALETQAVSILKNFNPGQV
jgi:hypothetical protein